MLLSATGRFNIPETQLLKRTQYETGWIRIKQNKNRDTPKTRVLVPLAQEGTSTDFIQYI